MRQPKNLKEAKAIFKEERAKVGSSASAIAGSRWLTAILATFVIAFGTHLLYAPARLPTVGGLSLTMAGLPPSVDFGFAGDQAKQAAAAAQSQDVRAHVQEFVAENSERVPLFNMIGFSAALVLLLGNMWIITARRRVSRG